MLSLRPSLLFLADRPVSQLSAAERKRSKEERDLITRTKVFARIQTAQDHEDLVEGLLCACDFTAHASDFS